jgi:hypothetical protein
MNDASGSFSFRLRFQVPVEATQLALLIGLLAPRCTSLQLVDAELQGISMEALGFDGRRCQASPTVAGLRAALADPNGHRPITPPTAKSTLNGSATPGDADRRPGTGVSTAASVPGPNPASEPDESAQDDVRATRTVANVKVDPTLAAVAARERVDAAEERERLSRVAAVCQAVPARDRKAKVAEEFGVSARWAEDMIRRTRSAGFLIEYDPPAEPGPADVATGADPVGPPVVLEELADNDPRMAPLQRAKAKRAAARAVTERQAVAPVRPHRRNGGAL